MSSNAGASGDELEFGLPVSHITSSVLLGESGMRGLRLSAVLTNRRFFVNYKRQRRATVIANSDRLQPALPTQETVMLVTSRRKPKRG